jgi:ABC-2 type transport system ATP-binding protein
MIAQALLADPSVLILDEPTTGLDPRQRIQLRTVLQHLATTKSVVVATHLVEDVDSVADWLTILDAGQVVHDGSLAEVRARWSSTGSAVEAAYLELVRS